ncbi:MAG: ParA family protein [Hyphomicrobiaceae bacterium]
MSAQRPFSTIAVMNAKGGVGKSTLTLALAETLAVYHRKRILLIDADGQMSLSLMLMPVERLNALRDSGKTLTDILAGTLPGGHPLPWKACVAESVGDVEEAEGLFLIPGNMDLPLVERGLAKDGDMRHVRAVCRTMLQEASQHVDMVIVDCAPGISVTTECWLRECNWHLVPVRPDVLAIGGVQYVRHFRMRDPHLGFSRHLGVVVNMKQLSSQTDETIHQLLMSNADMRCFRDAVPTIPHIQKAALYSREGRSYVAKYPGTAGTAIRTIAAEVLSRIKK